MKFIIISLMSLAAACGNGGSSRNTATTQTESTRIMTLKPEAKDTVTPTTIKPTAPTKQGYKIVKTYPHSSDAYTQGLYFKDGFLYEGTGLEGHSYIRKVDIATGKVLKEIMLNDDKLFGEGIAEVDGKIYQLTWQNQRGFIYDAQTFEKLEEFTYEGEGWGLTTDGKMLYMSNGTDKIYVIDPKTLSCNRIIEVHTNLTPIEYLNELEWIEGEIWANVYQSDYIVRIDPATGSVKSIVNLNGILPQSEVTPSTDVLNGIAYDPETRRIFVTGKKWSKLFEIEVFGN